jgi:hypothetical protein
MNARIQLKSILLTLFLLLFIAACNQETPDAPEESPEPERQVTPEEQEEPEEVDLSSVQFVPLIDNENGLSLQYPANWVTHSSISGTTVASSESIIQAESLANIGEEAFVVIIPGEVDVFNFQTSQSFTQDDIIRVLETYKVLLEKEGQAYVLVEPPQAFTGNNQNMARMVLRSTEGGQPIITVMAVIMADNYMALVSAASNQEKAEELQPIFYQIIESIEVRAPGSFSDQG